MAPTICRWEKLLKKQLGKFKIQSCKCECIFGSVGQRNLRNILESLAHFAARNLFIEASGNEFVMFVDPKGSV